MKRSDIEIMAPVGSYESLTAAIQAHADSIYFGIENLNMRSRSANNFTTTDLQKITQIAQQHNLKTYLTVNTVIYDDELPLMRQIINAAKQNNITAIIASDIAAITYAHSIGLEVHISTQCNVSNYETLRFYSQYADVIVLARELNLNQVKQITQRINQEQLRGPKGQLIRIEMFAHGALCMAISGKCYLSLDNMAASANRGQCLQICRRRYTVTDTETNTQLEIDGKYIMSPKDLKTINFLDQMINAGVTVFKIEGRARSADYVKTVCQAYHQAACAITNGTLTPNLLQQLNTQLAQVFNRGFWDGYYLGQKLGEWNDTNGNKATTKKLYIGKVTNYFQKINIMELKLQTDSLTLGDHIIAIGPTSGVIEQTVTSIRGDNNTPLTTAPKGQTISIPMPARLRPNDKIYKIIPTNTLPETPLP